MVDRIFGLPHMPEADFNRLMKQKAGVTAPLWKDVNSNKLIEPNEIKSSNLSQYITKKNGQPAFTPKFQNLYKKIAEHLRQEKVQSELKLTYMEPVNIDVKTWLKTNTRTTDADIANYQAGIKELMSFSNIMKLLYQRQIGYTDKLKNEGKTKSDRELISRYGHPWCLGDQGPFCVASPKVAERSSGIYLDGVTCEEAKDYADPFSVVRKDINGKVFSIPYATAFKKDQEEAAKYLKEAAKYFGNIEVEKSLASHLLFLAEALASTEPFPYDKADKAWRAQGESNSVILFRAGADEIRGDGVGDSCITKARYHFRLGFANYSASKLVNKYNTYLQRWKNSFAELIGDPNLYKSQKVVLKLPQFYDVIYEKGDDVGGPNGTAIGQTLPNWCGKDGKEEPCQRRIMIYVNKTERTYNDKIMKRYIMPLFHPSHMSQSKSKGVGINSVVLHEIAHNFGPQLNKTKRGTQKTYKQFLGKWSLTIEELKAQTSSLYLGGKMLKEARAQFKSGKISETELKKAELYYRQHVLYNLGWALRMILRATRSGKFEGSVYSKLAAIQIGFFSKIGAISYDTNNGWWKVNFEDDKFLNGTKELMKTVLKHYAEADSKKVDTFVRNYIEGDGFKLLHAERIRDVAGTMPSVLFKYSIEGLE